MDTKTCPFCKEEIHRDALKCKHCKSLLGDYEKVKVRQFNVGTTKAIPQLATVQVTQPRAKKESSTLAIISLVCGLASFIDIASQLLLPQSIIGWLLISKASIMGDGIIGLFAIICGFISIKRKNYTGISIVGISFGCIALAYALLWIL